MREESPRKRSNKLAVGDAVWMWNYCNSPPCKWMTPQAAC